MLACAALTAFRSLTRTLVAVQTCTSGGIAATAITDGVLLAKPVGNLQIAWHWTSCAYMPATFPGSFTGLKRKLHTAPSNLLIHGPYGHAPHFSHHTQVESTNGSLYTAMSLCGGLPLEGHPLAQPPLQLCEGCLIVPVACHDGVLRQQLPGGCLFTSCDQAYIWQWATVACPSHQACLHADCRG